MSQAHLDVRVDELNNTKLSLRPPPSPPSPCSQPLEPWEVSQQSAPAEQVQQPEPESQLPVNVTMKLALDFSAAGAEGSSKRASFEALLISDLARAAGMQQGPCDVWVWWRRRVERWWGCRAVP